MMVPARPMADLIVGQASLTLAPLETLFNTMLRLRHPGEGPQRRLRLGIGQVKIHFHHLVAVALTITAYYHHLRVAFLALGRPRYHPSFDEVDHQWAFGPVAYVNRRPSVGRQRGAPLIDPLPRALRTAPPAASRRRIDLLVTHQGGARHGQQISLGQLLEPAAKPIGTAHLVIAGDPA